MESNSWAQKSMFQAFMLTFAAQSNWCPQLVPPDDRMKYLTGLTAYNPLAITTT